MMKEKAKTKPYPGRADLPGNHKRLCKLYKQLSTFAADLDKLPEAQEVRRYGPMAVPYSELPMVF